LSFYKELSKKFFESENFSKKTKFNTTDFILQDFIERDGKMILIYDEEVTIQDIVSFFKKRMPWVRIILKPELVPSAEDSPNELLMAKSTLYGQLVDLLESTHANFTKAFKKTNSMEEEIDDFQEH